MAASFGVPSALSASPPGVVLPQRNSAVLPLSNLVFFSRCRSLEGPSLIDRQINNRRSRLRHQPVVHAGLPSTSTLILVFALPLSLLIGTIVVSLRIGHQLDEKFLEELALHQALMEENEDEEGDERIWVSNGRAGEEERVPVKEEVGSVRIRNRPKREKTSNAELQILEAVSQRGKFNLWRPKKQEMKLKRMFTVTSKGIFAFLLYVYAVVLFFMKMENERNKLKVKRLLECLVSPSN